MIASSPEEVWALLTDAHELARAMPGAGEVEAEDGRRFRTTISLAVGPVKDRYEGRLAYEDEEPPSACTIVIETKGRAGHVAGRGAMHLEAQDGGATLVRYQGDFKVSGPVAGVGQRMIAGVARKTIERTLDGIARRLTAPAAHVSAGPVPGLTPDMAPATRYWHPFANMAKVEGNELVIVRGHGSEVFDRDGRSYIDATAALWYCNVGYGREAIAEAVDRQLRELHAYSTFGAYANEPALALADRLAALAPLDDARVFLTSGGSDAVDTAAKIVRRYWHAVGQPEKTVVIGRKHAYHGMHAWGTSLGGIPANVEGLGKLVADVVHVEADSAGALESAIGELGAERVAAFIGEPVVGAGGVIPPPDGYWSAVAELCREHDVLLVADEVITGFGRLGQPFGCERFDFTPDLFVFAKGVTSGYMPLGGVLVGPRVQEPFWSGDGLWFRHGYTYSGHAGACAAALANLDILEREHLVERVAELEPMWAEKIHSLADHPLVAETRAIGLLGAVELAPELVDGALALARERGVLTRPLRGCALQLSPPFVIEPEQIDRVVDGLRGALDALAESVGDDVRE